MKIFIVLYEARDTDHDKYLKFISYFILFSIFSLNFITRVSNLGKKKYHFSHSNH